MSGLSVVAEVGRAGRREARDHAARGPVWISWIALETRIVALPAVLRRCRRAGAAPSRSEIIPAGIGSGIGIGFASPKRLSTRIDPDRAARAARAPPSRRTCSCRARRATILPLSEPFGQRAERSMFGSAAEPHRCGSTGLPSVPTIERDVDERLVRASPTPPGSFAPPAPWIGTAPSDGGPPDDATAPVRRRASSRRRRPRSRPVRCPASRPCRGRSPRGRCRRRSPARRRRARCCGSSRTSRRSPDRSAARRPRS